MAVSFSGRPPVVAVPSSAPLTTESVTPDVDVIKGVLVACLAATKGQSSASEQIDDSDIQLLDDVLEIRLEVSSKMLPILINAEAERVMKTALRESGLSGIRIKLIPKAAQSVGTVEAGKKPSNYSARAAIIDASFKRLSQSATRLNDISDKLSKQVEQIDAALRRLNLGVTAWVKIKDDEDEDGNCYGERVGYTKFGNRWCVALRTYSAVRGDPSGADENTWAFIDAPRQIRIRAIEYIPKLLESLCLEADRMIDELAPRVEDLVAVTTALSHSNGGR